MMLYMSPKHPIDHGQHKRSGEKHTGSTAGHEIGLEPQQLYSAVETTKIPMQAEEPRAESEQRREARVDSDG